MESCHVTCFDSFEDTSPSPYMLLLLWSRGNISLKEVEVEGHKHTYIHTYIHTYMYIHVHTCMPTCPHECTTMYMNVQCTLQYIHCIYGVMWLALTRSIACDLTFPALGPSRPWLAESQDIGTIGDNWDINRSLPCVCIMQHCIGIYM